MDLGVSSASALDRVAAAARTTGQCARIHLKIDTGLGRAGCPPGQWEAFVQHAKALQDAGCWRLWVSGRISQWPTTRVTR